MAKFVAALTEATIFNNCLIPSAVKINVELSKQELSFLLALLESDKQTALQLLAADHFYEPKLLPKLRKAQRALKTKEALSESC